MFMAIAQIGRYEIVEELTQGGMGVIFLANDPYVRRQVIVKVLTYQYSDDEVYNEFFQHEAEIIAALEHACIAPVYDFGWHGKQPYIVMRYMAGGSLEDRLKQGQWPKLTEIAHIYNRVADALDAAHARNVVHRDVKPSNILFDVAGEPFLADFGIAKTANLTEEADTWFVGTPAYMSPEQVQDKPLDGRSDVYAMGVMLYRLLTRQLPFHYGSVTELVDAHIHLPVPPIQQIDSNLPAVWQEIIGRAMAKDPAGRYASAGDFARDVREVVSGRWYLRKL
jgi:serine/threonine protein kinase